MRMFLPAIADAHHVLLRRRCIALCRLPLPPALATIEEKTRGQENRKDDNGNNELQIALIARVKIATVIRQGPLLRFVTIALPDGHRRAIVRLLVLELQAQLLLCAGGETDRGVLEVVAPLLVMQVLAIPDLQVVALRRSAAKEVYTLGDVLLVDNVISQHKLLTLRVVAIPNDQPVAVARVSSVQIQALVGVVFGYHAIDEGIGGGKAGQEQERNTYRGTEQRHFT